MTTTPTVRTEPAGTDPVDSGPGQVGPRYEGSTAAADMPSVAKAAAWALGACIVLCLLLLFAARAAGADLQVVRSDGRTVSVTPSSVVVTLMLAVLVGTIALGAIGRRSRRAWTAVALGGAAIGLASVVAPLSSEATALTTFVLVAMHVVSAVAWFGVLVSLLPRR